MKKPVWRLELQKAFPRQKGIMVGVHDRQSVSSLIKVLELTGRRRFAKAVASCLWAVQAPRRASLFDDSSPLPAAVVRRGIGRLLCRARPQRSKARVCLFRGRAG